MDVLSSMESLLTSSVQASLGYFLYNALGVARAPVTLVQQALGRASQDTAAFTWERLGVASRAAPKGPIIWFNAHSMGECAVALPVIFRCLLEYNENVHILLTVGAQEAHKVLSGSLPRRVIVQHMPFENPMSVRTFLRQWRPQVGIFVESPAWPTIVEVSHQEGVRLALLNARMSTNSFLRWFRGSMSRALLERVVSRFTLIVPQSDIDVGRFRMMGATLQQMPGWCSDLKYAAALGTSVWHLWRPSTARILALKQAVAGRPVWVAASTHDGEEAMVGRVHEVLSREWSKLMTFLVPRQSGRCEEVKRVLEEDQGLSVAMWSDVCAQAGESGDLPLSGVDCVVVDVIADLPLLYSVCEIAFIGNSLVEGGAGHNLAEAAVAGCAVLVGENAGHFNQMGDELNQAAVMAAEEAAAAVNSSGPLEDAFSYNQDAAAQPANLSPRDANPGPQHWHGVLDEHPRASSVAGSRPSTAPAAYGQAEVRRTYSSTAAAAAAAGGAAGGGSGQGAGRGAGRSMAGRPTAMPAAAEAYDPTSPSGSAYSPLAHISWEPDGTARAHDTLMLGESGDGTPTYSPGVYSQEGMQPSRPAVRTSRLHEHHQQQQRYSSSGVASGPPSGPPPSAATNTPTGPWGGGASPASSLDGGPLRDEDGPECTPFALSGCSTANHSVDDECGADDSSLQQRSRQRPQQHGQRQQQQPKPASRHTAVHGAHRFANGQSANGADTPGTPNPTPDDSAHAAGGRSPVAGAPGSTSTVFMSQPVYLNGHLESHMERSSMDVSIGLPHRMDAGLDLEDLAEYAPGACEHHGSRRMGVMGPGSAAAARAARTGSIGGCDDARPSSPLPGDGEDELPTQRHEERQWQYQQLQQQQQHGAPAQHGQASSLGAVNFDDGPGHAHMGRSPTMSELVRDRGASADSEAGTSHSASGGASPAAMGSDLPAVDLYAGARLSGNGVGATAVAYQRGGWEDWRRSSDGDGHASNCSGAPADGAGSPCTGGDGMRRSVATAAPLGLDVEDGSGANTPVAAHGAAVPSGLPKPRGAAVLPPLRRGSVTEADPSPLGDPGRATHYMDHVQAPSRLNLPPHVLANLQREDSASGAYEDAIKLLGGTGMDSMDNSVVDFNGAATPASGYSPTHSATTGDFTPSWAQATPLSSTGAFDSASMRAPWRSSHHPYTPRLPRHDEHAPSAFDCTHEAATPTHTDGRLTSSGGGAPPVPPPPPVPVHDSLVGTSYMRFRGEYILPATHLPYAPHGPAVWRVSGESGLALAVSTLLREPLERRSRGHAAAQAAAKLASGLVSTVWHVLDDMVIAPSLQEMVQRQAETEAAAAARQRERQIERQAAMAAAANAERTDTNA